MRLTEAKLKQLISEVLEEGMKTIADLPENVFIKIDASLGDLIEIYYSDANGLEYEKFLSSESPTSVNDKNSKGGGAIGLDTEVQMSREFPCLNAMMIAFSAAEKGWGPLLYDIAIELATLKGGGLVADRTVVSNLAYDVWDKYENTRSDVEFTQLDNEQDSFENGNQDDCLQYSAYKWAKRNSTTWLETPISKLYRKEPTTIQSLKNSGKLIVKGIDI